MLRQSLQVEMRRVASLARYQHRGLDVINRFYLLALLSVPHLLYQAHDQLPLPSQLRYWEVHSYVRRDVL
jgi:hypothetical protein